MPEGSHHRHYKKELIMFVEKYLLKKNINVSDLDKDYVIYKETDSSCLNTISYPIKKLNGYIPDYFFFSKDRDVLLIGEAKTKKDFNNEYILLPANIAQITKGIEFIYQNNDKKAQHIFCFCVPFRNEQSMKNTINAIYFKVKSKYKSDIKVDIIGAYE